MRKNFLAGIQVLAVLQLFAADIPRLTPTMGWIPDYQDIVRYQAVTKKLQEAGRETLTPEEDELLMMYEECAPHLTVGDGCSWYCGGGPESVGASSVLPDQAKNSYKAGNVHDFSILTAWVEGKAGHGIGEKLRFSFKADSPRINQVLICNGYQKSPESWKANGRVKVLRMLVDDQPVADLMLKDTLTQQVFDTGILWEKDGKAHTLTFQIRDVYPGSRWEDTCISEINFNGLDVH